MSGLALAWQALDPPVRLQGILPEHLLHGRWSFTPRVLPCDAEHVGIRVELEALALRPVTAEHHAVFAEHRPQLVEPVPVDSEIGRHPVAHPAHYLRQLDVHLRALGQLPEVGSVGVLRRPTRDLHVRQMVDHEP